MSRFAFADERDGLALGAYLERLLTLDKTAAIRLVGVGPVVAAYSAPPLHGSASRGVTVLAVRTLALDPDAPSFDRTVGAGRLLDAIEPDSRGFALPDALLGGPSWAGLMPPRTGWRPVGELTLRQLTEAVAQGNADFRFGALGRDRAGLDALAEEIWTREFPLGLRWRAAHAAAVMGFLGQAADPATAPGGSASDAPRPDTPQSNTTASSAAAPGAPQSAAAAPGAAGADVTARVAAHTRWLRLDAPFGTVIERMTGE
ncbi:MAG TPA: hypothetical protein VFU73_03580 [Actinocrinis sp.]|nr:hypothetical protein [Actinocrinis sp.]